jgi:hypothetical protein
VLRTPPLAPTGLVFKRKKNMEIKFVTEEEIAQKRGRKEKYPWAEFVEELYKYPNRWAEFPMRISNSASAYRVPQRFKDIEMRVSGGNNLANDHPDKLEWTVYLKYVVDVEEETF